MEGYPSIEYESVLTVDLDGVQVRLHTWQAERFRRREGFLVGAPIVFTMALTQGWLGIPLGLMLAMPVWWFMEWKWTPERTVIEARVDRIGVWFKGRVVAASVDRETVTLDGEVHRFASLPNDADLAALTALFDRTFDAGDATEIPGVLAELRQPQ